MQNIKVLTSLRQGDVKLLLEPEIVDEGKEAAKKQRGEKRQGLSTLRPGIQKQHRCSDVKQSGQGQVIGCGCMCEKWRKVWKTLSSRRMCEHRHFELKK